MLNSVIIVLVTERNVIMTKATDYDATVINFFDGISREEIIMNYAKLADDNAELEKQVNDLKAQSLIYKNASKHYEQLTKHYQGLYTDDEKIIQAFSYRVASLKQK